jgi:hypothetical protein
MLVEVHAGVQTTRLLKFSTIARARLKPIARACRWGEKPVGVEVRAADSMLLDHPVGLLVPQSERPC